MPTETGIWNQEEANQYHAFDYRLAQFIGQYFDKKTPVIDFGCGNASYLRYLHDIGFEDLTGIEGEQLSTFEISNIEIKDLTEYYDVGFDGNTICLEVGEHLPEDKLERFIDNLCRRCRTKIILSWAIPGQDGIGHVSCKHNIWVINEMGKRGFKLLAEDSLKARSVVEERNSYFRNTIMIFQR